MREALAAIDGARLRWTGTFVRFGTKPGFQGHAPTETILLRDIKDGSGVVRADHLWFNMTTEFKALALETGVVVGFEARVTEYERGYRGNREDAGLPPPSTDFKLSHPTKVHLVNPTRPGASPWTNTGGTATRWSAPAGKDVDSDGQLGLF